MKTINIIRDFEDKDLVIDSLEEIDERYFHINGLCPISLKEDVLSIALTESFSNLRLIENIKKTLQKKTRLFKTDSDQMISLKKDIFSSLTSKKKIELNTFSEHSCIAPIAENLALFTGGLSEIVKTVNRIIIQGYRENATDIHIQNMKDSVIVRYRIDGLLYDSIHFNTNMYEKLITRFKVMSRLDIAETRLPQSGRTTVRIDDKAINLRVSTLPTRTGEKISLRFLYGTHDLLSIKDLGMNKDQIDSFANHMSVGKGIFIIGGPTGTGKTTTLYSILQKLNDGSKNIITLEDPAEIEIGCGITQVQVNNSFGISFSEGIRAILRHDPDIIFIGEIRDRTSAQAAFEAALTGHLVLTTVHMPTIPDIVERLYQLEIDPLNITSSVIGVGTQRLVRKLCTGCSQKIKPSSTAKRFFADFELNIEYDFSATGCAACNNRGYKGRTGIFDNRYIDDENLISYFMNRGKNIKRKDKYIELAKESFNAIHKGITNSEEIIRSLW